MAQFLMAITKEGYHKDILQLDQGSVTMYDTNLEETGDGFILHPSKFPEADHFKIEFRSGDHASTRRKS